MGGFSFNMPGLNTQPMSGDSLTQYWRSLSNNMGNAGQSLLGAGVPTTNTGLGYAGTGMSTLGAANSTLDPAQSYWQAILSGDPNAMTAATAPTANMLSNVYGGAMNNTSQGTPMGGYRSSTMAMMPQSYASQVGNYLLGLQPTAAQNLNTIAGTRAGIGSAEGNLGLGVGQLGLGQSQIGSNLLQSTLQSLLQKLGINQGATNANMGMLTSGLESLVGAGGAMGAAKMSDRWAKEGIIPVGDYEGIPVYAFRYIGSDEVNLGVMAQEVREIMPEAVHEGRDGLLRVDYDLLFGRKYSDSRYRSADMHAGLFGKAA